MQKTLACLLALCSIVCGQELFQANLTVRWTASNVHYALALREQAGASVYFSAVEDEPLPPVNAPDITEIAYINGVTENGSPIRMKTCVVPYAENQRWSMVVDMPAKSQATISWTSSTTGRTTLIYEKDKKTNAMPFEATGELLLENPTDKTASFVVYIEILKSGYDGRIQLVPGWNLVSFLHKPGRSDEDKLAGTGAWRYDEKVNAYIRTDVIEAGYAYWIFSRNSQVFWDLGDETPADRPLRQGWNLIGVQEEKNLPTDGYNAFFWDNGHFKLTDTLKPGLGYWIYAFTAGSLP